MRRAIFVLALVLASLCGAARAQEEATAYEYVLDEQTELTLTSNINDRKIWSIEVRQFGEPAQGQIFTFTGDLKRISKDVYEFRGGEERNPRTVRIAGKPGEKTPLEFSIRNITYDDAKPVRIHGTFKPIDPILREVRTKERFQKADDALIDLLARISAEVGKGGEARLREVQAERTTLRDTLAVASVGGPEALKQGYAYWYSMFTSTIDNINFLRGYTGRAVPKGASIAGSYRAPNGATLELELPADGGLKFTIYVPHPDASLTGQLTGTARLYGTRAIYKEAPGRKEGGETREPAEAIFSVRGGHIVHVEAKNTDAFTGEGVSFDGDYYKTVPPAPRK